MSLLDAERARATLGQRLADRFLQYARRPGADEAPRLGVHIDEHLTAVRKSAPADLHTAGLVAAACKRLLMRIASCGPDEQAAIVGAVRYFLDTHDIERDDEARGFVDDAQVLNYVLAAVAPDLAPIPV